MPAGILGGLQSHATTSCPPGFSDQQRAAWAQFQSLPMPARTDQAWRFSNVGALDLSPYHYARHRCPRPTAARFSNAPSASMKSPAGWSSPTINSCERDRAFGKTAQGRRDLSAARAGDDRARGSVPPPFHEPAGHARLRQICRAARGVRSVGNFSLRAARRGSRIAARNVSLAACARTPRFSRTRSSSPTNCRK